MEKLLRQREYYKKYYETHKEYFKNRNSAPEKKAYYKKYYQMQKQQLNLIRFGPVIPKQIIIGKIMVNFD